MSYEAVKSKAINTSLSGRPRFSKQHFKQLTTQLCDHLGLKPQDLSQLWELAEPDDRGEVNKSYVEEMIDMIHAQHEEQVDARFDVVNGLKFVNQEIFHNETTRTASLEDIRKLVQKSFENGQGLIMERIEGIAKKGKVDRIELMELIESIEHQQLFGDNLDTTLDQINTTMTKEDNVMEEYSEEREKDLYSILKLKLETATKEGDRAKATLGGTAPVALNSLCGLLKSLPQTFKKYAGFSKQQCHLIEMLKTNLAETKKSGSSQTNNFNAELLKANRQIFELQAELDQKAKMIDGLVEKAIKDIKGKLVADFKVEKISLMDTINSLESNIREVNHKLAVAEEGRSSLIDMTNNLENQVAVLKSTQDPKVKRVLELALEDPDFYQKIMEAASKVECLDTNIEDNPELEELRTENRRRTTKMQELQKFLDDGTNFIEVLQTEIRDLKEHKVDEKQQSIFGLMSEQNPELTFLSNPGLPPTESLILNTSPMNRLPPLPQIPSPEKLTTWTNLFYVREGQGKTADRTKELSEEIEKLSQTKNVLENDLKSTSKYLAEAKVEIEKLSKVVSDKDGTIKTLKEELANKSILLNNCQAKLAELKRQLVNHAADNYLAAPLLALIDAKDAPQSVEATPSTVAPMRDIAAEILKNKLAMQSATQSPSPRPASEANAEGIDRKEVELKEREFEEKKDKFEAEIQRLNMEHQEMSSHIEKLQFQLEKYGNPNVPLLTVSEQGKEQELVAEQVSEAIQTSKHEVSVDQTTQHSMLLEPIVEKIPTYDASYQTEKPQTLVKSIETDLLSSTLETAANPCYMVGNITVAPTPKEEKPVVSMTSVVHASVTIPPQIHEKTVKMESNKTYFDLKPTFVQEEDSDFMKKTISPSQMQSTVIASVKGAFDAGSLELKPQTMPGNSIIGETTSAEKRIDEVLKQKLEQLKRPSFYFEETGQPQSQFMQGDSPPQGKSPQGTNPFMSEESLKEQRVENPQEIKVTQKVPIPSSLFQSDLDPIAIAQSLKNPYTDDNDDGVPDEGSHLAPSRLTFDMNSPDRQRLGPSDTQSVKSPVFLLEERQFATHQPSKQFTMPGQFNPYLEPVEEKPAEEVEAKEVRQGRAQSKLKNLLSLTNQKRPGRKQLDAINDIVKKSTLNHPEEDRVKLKQEAIKNRPVEDFLQLARNKHFANIMDKMKDYTDPSCIYTDHVCRINRWGTRKVKLIAVTDKFFYLLEPEESKDGSFKIKMSIYLPYIRSVVLARDNSTCFTLSSTTEADQLLESYRRTALILKMKDAFRKLTNKEMTMEIKKQLVVINSKCDQQMFNPMTDKKFRYDIQLMFNFAEMVGVVKILKENLLFTQNKFCILILVSVGLLVLDIEDMKFLDFLPLIGSLIRQSVRGKLQNSVAYDIYRPENTDNFKTFIFKSSLDAHAWITKIQKMQRYSPEGAKTT